MIENVNALCAFKAKDARFDGRFFVGISSTGIYCRPVCRAKQPKAENCTFYRTAAEASRPDTVPVFMPAGACPLALPVTDATADLICRAARMLEENCGNGLSLEEIAGRLGCSSRHLRRVFTAEYNVSPVQYCRHAGCSSQRTCSQIQTCQYWEVAMAAGFQSLRRFNDLFRKRVPPFAYGPAKTCGGRKKRNDNMILALGYRPPYRWEEMLAFLARNARSPGSKR